MLIAGLIALLSLLFGSNDLPFLIPKEEKAMDKVIYDKAKRKQLNDIFERVEKYEKKFRKEKKSYVKQLEKLNVDQKATPTQFIEVGETILRDNAETFDFMVSIRLAIGELISQDEWTAIVKEGRKRYNKSEKQYVKVYPTFEKAVNILTGRIESIITDKVKAKVITEQILNFHKLTVENTNELSDYNVFDNPVLANIESSEKDLRALNQQMLQLRSEVFDEYVVTRNLIATNCTPKEWPRVVKKFNKLF